MAGTFTTKHPPFRKLRGYAFDPSLSLKIDTAGINDIIYKVPWEEPLTEGPAGAYVEVIDYDPTIDKFIRPVDLNDDYVLAQDGLTPSESNPQYHQQMTYAVAMTTIKNFEQALGRSVMWSPHIREDDEQTVNQEYDSTSLGYKKKVHYDFVQRLRIYPHAFRDANAFYSPQKKALLFGYFSAQPAEVTMQMPNSVVFTCLSHDIIAHETTHAILDGMYRRYIDATNIDVLAFHEGFADIVALFQHFTFPEVLKNQIAKTHGDLASQSLLGELAQQFGTAIGSYGALRDAIGYIDETNQWKPKVPNGNEYQTIKEPHARGAILVSTVFDAFLTIYKSRVADLLRIATSGTGILPQGELHPDLVNRLATEASRTAAHVLEMCIRSLDYCPPVDITFGDYLRGIITADIDLVADDKFHYRLAFIDAFRKRGIYPAGIKNLSPESLCYPNPSKEDMDSIGKPVKVIIEFLRAFRERTMYVTDREELFNLTADYVGGRFDTEQKITGLHHRINTKFLDSQKFQLLTGLVFNHQWAALGIRDSFCFGKKIPAFEVHSLKMASRTRPDGTISNQIILTLVQRCGIESVTKEDDGHMALTTFQPDDEDHLTGDQFIMTGGCTLIFDLDTLQLKYAISKPLLNLDLLREKGRYEIDAARALRIRNVLNGSADETNSLYEAYFGMGKAHISCEPFAFLHQL